MEHTVLQLMKSLPFQGGMSRMKMPPGGVVERRFPRRGLFVLSAMIGAVGAMNILLGLVDLANILTSLNRCQSEAIVSFVPWNEAEVTWSNSSDISLVCLPDILSFLVPGIWCGGMIVIAGAVGVGAARTSVIHRQAGLKVGFLVLCVLNAAIFGPIMFLLLVANLMLGSVEQTVSAAYYVRSPPGVAVTECLLALFSIVLAIVGASLSCCCAREDREVAEKVVGVYPPWTSSYLATSDLHQYQTKDKSVLLSAGQLPPKIPA